jgi:hypothetical protein
MDVLTPMPSASVMAAVAPAEVIAMFQQIQSLAAA